MEEEQLKLIEALSKRLDIHDNNRKSIQENLLNACNELRKQIDELEVRVNSELEEEYTKEDDRLQEVLSELRTGERTDLPKLMQKARLRLLIEQTYEFKKQEIDLSRACGLKTGREVSKEWVVVDKPRDLNVVRKGTIIYASFTPFSSEEEKIFIDTGFKDLFSYKVSIVKNEAGSKAKEYKLQKEKDNVNIFSFHADGLETNSTYSVRVRTLFMNKKSPWSDSATFSIQGFNSYCLWKECPPKTGKGMKYSVDPTNQRIARKIGINVEDAHCTIVGNSNIPPNMVTSWKIRIGEDGEWVYPRDKFGKEVFIGVAPFDVDRNARRNQYFCGWYFHCYDSTLWSGPPHDYRSKAYGPRKGRLGDYVSKGDVVGVVMDAKNGELSFALQMVNLGAAFEGIPLDKPLTPCVLLGFKNDEVELILSEAKEVLDETISAPSIFIPEGTTTWNSITIKWDAAENASMYQIEVDGKKTWHTSTTNMFTLRGLFPDSEHTFKVRTVARSSVGAWGSITKGKTLIAPDFYSCTWKECPSNLPTKRRYAIRGENSRVAVYTGMFDCCTVIGNAPIPRNQVVSWNFNILETSRDTHIGVAPFDIDQSISNYCECGWYFTCYNSALYSGPPHNYRLKSYASLKHSNEGPPFNDIVGVVMDMTKGELSYVSMGVNLGVAYEGIPLDKPLVPCAILYRKDHVKLDFTGAKNNIYTVPSSVEAKSNTCDSVTLTWDATKGASSYQIEICGSKIMNIKTSSFTIDGLVSGTEYVLRVRAVYGSITSEWSAEQKVKTQKKSLETSAWIKYSHFMNERKYAIDESNPKIVTATSKGFCTIIGDVSIPPGELTSWNVKILKSCNNDGSGIYIGVAPYDKVPNSTNRWGWCLNCYNLEACSGQINDCELKERDPQEKRLKRVHVGDTIGVVMDTKEGVISFSLNGVNTGVVHRGIPLGKLFVPCVTLFHEGDSVEMGHLGANAIPVPSNLAVKDEGLDAATLTWNSITGASYYQVEICGINTFNASRNMVTIKGFIGGITYNFRVRTAWGDKWGEWSGTVSRKAHEASDFSCCKWMEPLFSENAFSIDKTNQTIATRKGAALFPYTLIGNTPIPMGKVSSWSVKILNSKDNDGKAIWIGVAPFDIGQNDYNYYKCGWYFNCYDSSLHSGPPHSYRGKPYGPRKRNGQYMHTGDSVGIVIDTTNSDLLFVVGGMNPGVAYKWIPLDKPLVPCALLSLQSDSVELSLPKLHFEDNNLNNKKVIEKEQAKQIEKQKPIEIIEVKDEDNEPKVEMNGPPKVPCNIEIRSATWNSVTIDWDSVKGASRYQAEVYGKSIFDVFTNALKMNGFFPETEYNFRIRSVAGTTTSEWSQEIKGKTPKAPDFSSCIWKECRNDGGQKSYSVEGNDCKTVTCISDYCTVIGNTPIYTDKDSVWTITIIRSIKGNGEGIYVGVAPYDIVLKDSNNHEKCGWYISCRDLTLHSGPPQNYRGKKYITKDETEACVSAGCVIGVSVHLATRGVSFYLNQTSYGIAFEGIPFDKPLIPCVLLRNTGDSVELST